MEAFYLDGSRGQLFSIYHPAARPRHPRLGLVYVPPFAEEMNRTRRMAALQARRLAELGVDVLLLDPFGTGDSAGEFGEARWEGWCDDVRMAIAWLGARTDGQVGLWGVRLGALMAADIAAASPGRIACLVLWQPVLSGDRYLTQFLRLRVAATMDKGADRESTKNLKARLAQGVALEIAGYQLAPVLADSIAAAQLQSRVEQLSAEMVYWLEVASEEQPSLTSASQQVVDVLKGKGHPLLAKAVNGEPFWAVQEITLAPNLLQATDDLFRT
jgi:exosortase A-associated hydrolase 2